MLDRARARLYHPSEIGLVDLRARFRVHGTVKPDAEDVPVAGEVFWKVPHQLHLASTDRGLPMEEALSRCSELYQGFIDSEAIAIPPEGLDGTQLNRLPDGTLEFLTTPGTEVGAMISRVVLAFNDDGLVTSMRMRGGLMDVLSAQSGSLAPDAEGRTAEQEQHFEYTRVGDKFALVRMTGAMADGTSFEATAELREVSGFTIPVAVEVVSRSRAAPAWRGLMTLTLEDPRINTGIGDEVFASNR